MTERMILFGAGGHAKVVLEAWQVRHPDGQAAILDDRQELIGHTLLGVAIVGGREWLNSNLHDVQVMPALGDNVHRFALIAELRALGRTLATVIHPAAIIGPSARIGAGCFLAAGAVVNAEAELGEGVIVNTGASVDHDCRIGSAAHIGPGARLCGNVSIGAQTLIGTGAVVIPGITIGDGVVIGAGSSVIREVPSHARWGGSPARPL